MKPIYIFLTRTESIVSKIVHFFTKDTYTHSAIAFDRELVHLYSSGRKNGIKMFPAGPCRERLDRGFYARVGRTPCAVYELLVTDESYERAKLEVEWFMEHQDEFKFSALGIIACKFGMAWHRKNKFFCSQFVAEILTRSGAAKLPKICCLMRPSDYITLPGIQKIFEGDIGQVAEPVWDVGPRVKG